MNAKKPRFACVREEFYLLTGDFYQALVLNQLNYYQRAKDPAAFLEQESARSKVNDNGQGRVEINVGWFYKSADQLCEELMHPFKKSKAHEVIQPLIDRGWVMTRSNPEKPWDRVKQYRIDLVALRRDLAALGFAVPIWDEEGPAKKRKSISAPRSPFPSDGDDSSAGWRAIPEETAKGTTEEKNPPPFAGAKGAFSISSGLQNTLPEALGDVDGDEDPGSGDADRLLNVVPGAPHQGSRGKDWLDIVAREHAEAAQAFSTIFSGDPNSPLVSPEVARKFIKRRGGILGGKAIPLMARFFRHARFEGPVAPEWKKVRTFTQLLDTRNLEPALVTTRQAALDRIEELKAIKEYGMDPQYTLQQILMVQKNFPSGNLLELDRRREDIAAVAYIAHQRQHPELVSFQTAYHEELLAALIYDLYWIEFAEEGGFEMESVWGVSADEVRQAQERHWEPMEQEKKEIERLLQ